MDHKAIAEQMLAGTDDWVPGGMHSDGRPAAWPSFLTHALLALCDRLDDLACIVAVPQFDEDDG